MFLVYLKYGTKVNITAEKYALGKDWIYFLDKDNYIINRVEKKKIKKISKNY